MGRARIAVDAAMFTAAIGIDGAIERQVGGGIPACDALRMLDGDRGCTPRFPVFRFRLPSVVDALSRCRLEPPIRVPCRSAAATLIFADGDDIIGHLASLSQNKNKSRTNFRGLFIDGFAGAWR